ncbi:hypothetical protein E0500_004580 [Streptomyces sp. KM273126]|nr:hypothetical protein [Streptomyces sp. KM273126]
MAVKVSGLPITLTQPRAKPAEAPEEAQVRVLDRKATSRLGIDGLVFTVARADGDPAAASLGTTVDYSSFADAYSGNWSSRLRLIRLPECALTTPEKAECRRTTPVASENDAEKETVTAQVSVRGAPMVLALSAAASSDQGTYEATPLAASSTWQAGGSNGDFTWNYPLETPPAPAGPAPNLSIGYSAQSVDGRTSSTSAQPSWIGEGFDLPVSYIERAYGSCADDGQDEKYDLCWKEDNASLVLNGKSTPLVKGSDGEWRPKSDDGERVVRGTGAVNGDDGDTGENGDKGEFWTVTGTDGTQYVFGKDRLPGWSSGMPETNSVWTVPVFGDDSGEPGYSSGDSFSGRAKTQAWRWNLDYVVDPHGNVMTYWYTKETNRYAKNGTTGNGTAYTRGGWLKRIDYGQRTDTIFSTTQPAAARVTFTVAERCLPVTGGETCGSLTSSNRNAWPDVPFDQICKADTTCTDQPSPSFFTRKRLTDVTTQVYKDDDGNTWSYGYDFLGRRTSVSDPDAGASSSDYNDLDQVVAATDARKKTIGFTYDLLGRTTGKLDGRVPVVNGAPAPEDSKYLARWTYDSIAKGRLTSAIRYVGGKSGDLYALTNAKYDKLYRVLNEQYTISKTEGALAGTNGVWTINNAYNVDGTLQKRTIPAMGGLGQEVLQYGYTEQRMPDTLRGLTGIVQNTDYLPAGEQIRTTLGVSSSADWTEINRSYETGTKRLARQSVVSETHTGTDSDVYYRYDLAGNPVEIEDKATSPTDRQCFTYDGHRRLKAAWTATADCATAPAKANVGGPGKYWQSFTYDSAGNRKSATDHLTGAATSYTYKTADQPRPHALASTETKKADGSAAGRTSYTYDASGNTDVRTIGGKAQDLDFNAEGSLEKVTEADRTTTQYLNDADGNRLIRRDATGTTLYLGETELRLGKASGKVEATRYYTHGGQAVAMRTTAGLTWIASDHNGTASVQVDAATQAVTRRQMTPFGEDRGQAATAWVGERGFVGGTEDPTGLTHLGAREYDASTGRFVSVDPVADIKDPQQINGYAYSNNNPVTFADPDGRFFDSLIGLIVAVAVVVVAVVNYLSTRSSGSYGSGGMSSLGTGNYVPRAGSGDCPIFYTQRGICDQWSPEPADPRAEGSFKDFLAGAGHNLVAGAEAMAELSPGCWFEDCSGGTDLYDNFVEKHGADTGSKMFDSGDDAAEVTGLATGVGGLFKALAKKLLKNSGKKAAKEVEAPKPSCTKCFLAGTDVQMADGSTKDIEDVEVGDEVLATDPETGETGARKVTHLIITEDDKHFNELSIATDDGIEQLTATYEHPFWSPSQQAWIEAGDLTAGMALLTDEGDTVVVTGNRAYTDRARTYNLTVDDLHTYYVLAGQTPVLVHNSNCPLTGGFKVGVSPDEIAAINRGFGGETLLSGSPANTLANASRYNSFWDKSAVVIRDIAGSHMFNNGNKRTAQATVEQLMQRNGVTSGPTSADLRSVIDRVGKGQLHDVSDISAALRGY